VNVKLKKLHGLVKLFGVRTARTMNKKEKEALKRLNKLAKKLGL